MQFELSWRIVSFAIVVIGYLVVTQWPNRIAHIAHLGLSYFRPWRGDPWPQGVQEDDDVRWSWIRPRRSTRDDGGPTPTTRVRAVHISHPDHGA
jgi:hypothetical protein